MEKISVLRICYWCLLLISGFMLAIVFPKCTLKDAIMPLIMTLSAMGAGYVDRIIDEEKE